MSKSSIHIRPVKNTSERHNRREMKLDYVREDLSHKNESWENDTVKNRREEIKKKYEASVKQKMQKKATPIREGVFLFKPETTMEDCKRLASDIEKKFGIRTFQIHLHRDEGHQDQDEWKPNLHGHLVFDWTNPKDGKSIKLDKDDMSELQTLVAETLGMERGQSSDKKHLSALQWKNKKEKEKVLAIEAKLSDLRAEQDKGRAENKRLGEMLLNNRKIANKEKNKNVIEIHRMLFEKNKEIEKMYTQTIKEQEEQHKKGERDKKQDDPKKIKPSQNRGGGMSI